MKRSKEIKKGLVFMLALAMVFGLMACGTSQSEPSATDSSKATDQVSKESTESKDKADEDISIAVLLKPLSNEYWSTMKAGIEEWAKENNITVDVYAAESEEKIADQLDQMMNIINKNYDAICAAPLSAANLVEGVVQASKKGIPVVNIDETIDHDAVKAAGGSMVGQYTSNNIQVGEMAAKFIVEQIGTGQVAIIEGTAGNVASSDRVKGAADYFKSQEGIELVSSQPGNWDRLVALDVATNIMQTYPDLKAFYCVNDTMALGVYEAVKNANKTDQIIVVGTDAVQGAKESIAKGELTASVGQDNVGIGISCVQLAIKAVKEGWTPDPNADIPIYYVDCYLVTKDNVADYLN